MEPHRQPRRPYCELGLWDKAIEAAGKTLGIQPNFELARNNFSWALREKAAHRNPARPSPPRATGAR